MKNFILEHVLLPFGDRVLRSNFIERLRYWREVTRMPEAKLKNLQWEKLEKMLVHASQNSPFFKLQNVKRESDPYKWLGKFPVLKKSTYKENIEFFLTKDKNSSGLTSIMSSGSTGPPSHVYFSKEELGNNRSLQILWWEWAGYNFGNSLLQTGVNMNRSREKAIKDKLLNTRYISAMSHSEKDILSELKLLQSNPRDHFVAYASSIFLFAKTALENGIIDVKFKSIVSLGEKLLPQFRETIEKAFSCKVYDTYGASEGFLIASQCSSGNYHIMSPHVLVEILDDEGVEVKPGEMGRVVLTGLDNFTTPLLRYEVGDLAIKGDEKPCSCGLELPQLKEIIGRLTEFLVTPNGKYITVQNVVRVMKHFPDVDQFKMVQKKTDSFEVIYIKSPNSESVDELGIKLMFEDVFEEPLIITFHSVSQLPKAKSGKFQLIENHIQK